MRDDCRSSSCIITQHLTMKQIAEVLEITEAASVSYTPAHFSVCQQDWSSGKMTDSDFNTIKPVENLHNVAA